MTTTTSWNPSPAIVAEADRQIAEQDRYDHLETVDEALAAAKVTVSNADYRVRLIEEMDLNDPEIQAAYAEAVFALADATAKVERAQAAITAAQTEGGPK